jgi:hypothetical protein
MLQPLARSESGRAGVCLVESMERAAIAHTNRLDWEAAAYGQASAASACVRYVPDRCGRNKKPGEV